MLGCLRRLGCLAVAAFLMLLGGVAWFTRRWWLPMLPFGPAVVAQQVAWQEPTADGARRVDAALTALQRPRGQVFANVAPGDLLAYIMQEFAQSLPPSADSIRGAVVGDRLHIRARIRTADLGSAIGPLASLVTERENVEFAGTLHVIRAGLSEFQVKQVRVRDLPLPVALIPALVRQLSPGRSDSLAPDGLPLATPPYIGDVRVANGRITLYKGQ